MIIIQTLIGLLLFGAARFMAVRYNMHMLQLNGYKNGEHLHWLKKNISHQWLLIFGTVLGAVRFILPSLALDIVCFLTLYLIFLVFRAMKRLNTKKKLVFTPRVKRMLFTDGVLCVVIIALAARFAGVERLNGVLMILTGFSFAANMVANLLNRPVEFMVNQYYIQDAKRLLKSVPDLKIVGITGSYGKTSVKFYLLTLLREKYNVLATPESYNTPMGVVRTIRSSLKKNTEIFLCEMGARHVGDIKEICDIVHPHCGIITSIGPQHLETFFNMENIQSTKFELADALPEGGKLFLNGDNEYVREKAASCEKRECVYYSAGENTDGYYAKDIVLSQSGTEFTIVSPKGEEERFQMRLIGSHNVINVVGAIAAANVLGVPLAELKIPVRRLAPVAHRMQLLERGQVTVIDDAFNSNPVGSKAAVETLAMFDGVRILVTPGMVELGEKEEEYNFKFGTYAAKCCDYILLVGKNHTRPIQEGIMSMDFPKERCRVYDRLEEAMGYAYSIKDPGHKYILLENDLPDNY